MMFLFGIDFLTSVISVIAMLALGILTFVKGERHFSSLVFLFFTIISATWGILNYLNYQIDNEVLILWIIRSIMFLAVFQAFAFFLFIYTFPKVARLPKFITLVLSPLVIGVALLTLSPFVFSGIHFIKDGVSQPIPAPGVGLFGLLAIGLVTSGIIILLKKAKQAEGIEKIQFRYLLIGTSAMFSLVIIFNFLVPVLFQNTSFIPFSGVFILPFVVATTYSIFRHQLFDIRVIATELFVSLIIIVFLVNIFLSKNLRDVFTNGIMFVLITIFGILLVRGTIREIRELQRLSQAKSDFVSLVSHQLRTPLTAIKGFTSMIIEGSGTEKDHKDWLKKIYVSNDRLIRLVGDILDIARIEEGKMKYEFKPLDIATLISSVIAELSISAKDKGLVLLWQKPDMAIPNINADEMKLRQVILNLIDNAIHYTNKGWASVRLLYYRDLRKVIIVVQDTGVGIHKDDLGNLFGRFSRGKESRKSNTEGMGIGLYVARHIVAAHHGRIWAESEGPGTGSKFYVELPTA